MSMNVTNLTTGGAGGVYTPGMPKPPAPAPTQPGGVSISDFTKFVRGGDRSNAANMPIIDKDFNGIIDANEARLGYQLTYSKNTPKTSILNALFYDLMRGGKNSNRDGQAGFSFTGANNDFVLTAASSPYGNKTLLDMSDLGINQAHNSGGPKGGGNSGSPPPPPRLNVLS